LIEPDKTVETYDAQIKVEVDLLPEPPKPERVPSLPVDNIPHQDQGIAIDKVQVSRNAFKLESQSQVRSSMSKFVDQIDSPDILLDGNTQVVNLLREIVAR
jgi:hypothetical protein